jgi:mRNA m6A methyltransferase catalytic subunit
MSPSIPPFPSSTLHRPASSVSLPSGLGAGGRGKEKAPCRYLHFEVDYDGTIPEAEMERRRDEGRKNVSRETRGPHKLGIGLGPGGVEVDLVSSMEHHGRTCLHPASTASTPMDKLRSTKV